MSRFIHGRTFAAVAAGLTIALTAAACSSGGGDDGKAKVLHVYLAQHAWSDALVKLIPDYEKQTGIKVQVTELEQTQLQDQYSVKLNAGSKDIDVMMYQPQEVGKLYGQNGYTADLTSDVSKAGDWDWNDFLPPMRQLVTYDNKVLGVPVTSETEVLYYRKDLLAKAGLKPPTTLDQLASDAKHLKAQNPGTAGFIARTSASGAVTMFSSFLYSYGGTWFDDNGQSAINSPQARQAYDMYSSLIREDGPANVTTDMEWTDTLALFASGKSAFYMETSSDYNSIVDPKSSQIIGKVGVEPFPAGPQGSKPFFSAAYALGVNQFSNHKDESWDFIKWATSQQISNEMEKAGATGTRQSTLTNEDAMSGLPKDLRDAFQSSIKGAQPYDRPPVVQVDQAREIVGAPLAAGISGQNLDNALTKANSDFQALLDSEKK